MKSRFRSNRAVAFMDKEQRAKLDIELEKLQTKYRNEPNPFQKALYAMKIQEIEREMQRK